MEWNDTDVWRYLRETRSNPPGRASKGARRKTYCAALEQFEQLLIAASAVSAIARPLPLFYALSQATRAIVAAHKPEGQDWRITSHGMTWRTGGKLERSAGDVDTSGNFAELCEVFNCRRPNGRISFVDAWASLPDLRDIPLVTDVRTAIEVEPHTPPGYSIGTNHGIQQMPSFDAHLKQYKVGLSDGTTDEAIAEELAHYPSCPPDYKVLALASEFAPRVILGWEKSRRIKFIPTGDISESAPSVGTAHISGQGTWLLPRIGGHGPLDVAPLWWVLLFAMSNYARYSPAEWAKVMDVDDTYIAPRLEAMMQRAIERLPALVLQSVREAWHRDQPPRFVDVTDVEPESVS